MIPGEPFFAKKAPPNLLLLLLFPQKKTAGGRWGARGIEGEWPRIRLLTFFAVDDYLSTGLGAGLRVLHLVALAFHATID